MGTIQKASSDISAGSFHCEEHCNKRKTTGTVQVKTQSLWPRKISDKQERPTTDVEQTK